MYSRKAGDRKGLVRHMKDIEIITLEDYSDIRGALFSVSEADIGFLDKIQNIHFGKIHSNSIRGNHFIVKQDIF
jgi:hypothetical protein